jgi:hypothetical protein
MGPCKGAADGAELGVTEGEALSPREGIMLDTHLVLRHGTRRRLLEVDKRGGLSL